MPQGLESIQYLTQSKILKKIYRINTFINLLNNKIIYLLNRQPRKQVLWILVTKLAYHRLSNQSQSYSICQAPMKTWLQDKTWMLTIHLLYIKVIMVIKALKQLMLFFQALLTPKKMPPMSTLKAELSVLNSLSHHQAKPKKTGKSSELYLE